MFENQDFSRVLAKLCIAAGVDKLRISERRMLLWNDVSRFPPVVVWGVQNFWLLK